MILTFRVPTVVFTLTAALLIAGFASSARANVYATNVRLNGGTNDFDGVSGTNISISYLLNEPASLGVTIRICSGTNLLRAFAVPNGPGTLQGTNTVVWDGFDGAGRLPPTGLYSVSVTAASIGYTNWTQITSDTNVGNMVYDGRGIAVDRNANSLFYGRVFVTSVNSDGQSSYPGDAIGMLKLNADGSLADDGLATTGGHPWSGPFFSPWKIEVSADDYVYVSDLQTLEANSDSGGQVFRWDPTLSTNSLMQVLRRDNHLSTDGLSGPFISGSGSNTAIWMVDNTLGGLSASRGVVSWGVTPDGTCATNDTGTTIVGIGSSTNNLNLFPVDVAVDPKGVIYVVQDSPPLPGVGGLTSGDAGPRVLRFPASTNQATPELAADWAVGGDANSYGAFGVAVDPTGTYVAASFVGYTFDYSSYSGGNTKVLYATNGAVAAELDLYDGGSHLDRDCAWDGVGNVYYIDDSPAMPTAVWRAFSPPGTNQATTPVLQKVHLILPAPPIAYSQFLVTNQDMALPIVLAGSDPNNYPISFAIISQPTNGILTGSAPTVTYQPNPRYFGPDQFAFRVDGVSGSATGQVAIVVAKTSPLGPSTLTIGPPASGLGSLTLQGQPYEHYAIQASPDLVNWATITNLIPTNGGFNFIDPNAWQFPHRFYRAALQINLPQLSTPAFTADRQAQLTWTGDVGRTYQVLASTNLVNWDLLANLPATNSTLLFRDPDAHLYPARFYRALLDP